MNTNSNPKVVDYESTYLENVRFSGSFLISPIGILISRLFFFFSSAKGVGFLLLKFILLPLMTPILITGIIFEPLALLMYGKKRALIYFIQQEP